MRYGLGVGRDEIMLVVSEVDVVTLEASKYILDKTDFIIRRAMLNNYLYPSVKCRKTLSNSRKADPRS